MEARNSGHRIRGLSNCEEAALGIGIKARCDGLLRFHLWQGILCISKWGSRGKECDDSMQFDNWRVTSVLEPDNRAGSAQTCQTRQGEPGSLFMVTEDASISGFRVPLPVSRVIYLEGGWSGELSDDTDHGQMQMFVTRCTREACRG